MSDERCRGCDEPGWQGLVHGTTGVRYHERSVQTLSGSTIDLIRCTNPTPASRKDEA